MYRTLRLPLWGMITIAVLVVIGTGTFVYQYCITAEAEEPESYTVYLTFDDGPSAVTDEVLDVLKEEDISATFFVIGATTDHGIAAYQRILDEGHTIGLHSYTHNTNEIYRSFDDYHQDFTKLEDWLLETVDIEPSICRMPGGSCSRYCPQSLKQEIFSFFETDGYTCYDWDIDSKDSIAGVLSSEQLAQNVIQEAKQKNQQDLIILMHDDALRTSLPDALTMMIAYFKDAGYTFASLE